MTQLRPGRAERGPRLSGSRPWPPARNRELGVAETSSKAPSPRASGDGRACVLIVEDDATLRRMVVNYLEENNIRTLVAEGRADMGRTSQCRREFADPRSPA